MTSPVDSYRASPVTMSITTNNEQHAKHTKKSQENNMKQHLNNEPHEAMCKTLKRNAKREEHKPNQQIENTYTKH